ncbi:MAG: tRNA uridine-5-carboxymethylaminomethyl(34) synthesis GTPase MnmE, partial [Candidatus Dadabacteria bacterium]|nr:tRNA uridine-5-carboxymethylaminomethyl(34) synthesis GTPase MnmE [Candidatus Dadabacteria bacterium]
LVDYLNEHLGASNLREDTFVARTRHIEALTGARSHLEKSVMLCETDNSVLVAEELRLAQMKLGSITGEITADELLGEIFSRFCIGK